MKQYQCHDINNIKWFTPKSKIKDVEIIQVHKSRKDF